MKSSLSTKIVGLLLGAILLLTPGSTLAQTPKKIDDPAAPNRKSVGLVLSGGGAKGAAQLRVIKAIEEAGIPIDYIAGTSIGSIIGGLYAVGYTIEEIEELYTSMNWFDVFTDRNARDKQLFADKQKDDAYMFDVLLSTDDISMPSGIVRGDKFMDQLNELLLGYQHIDSFDKLPTPFACVSYDMNTGSEYVARGGSLSAAIRASMSIPGVFKPVKYKDMVLVDGGVYNNFPIDVVRDMGAEIVIGVDLSDGIRTDTDVENMIIIFEQLTTFLGRDKYERNLADCDYYIHPEIAPYTAASFNTEAVDSLLMRVQREADRHREGLQELRKKIGLPEGYMPPKRDKHYSQDALLRIGSITLKGFSKRERNLISRYLNLRPYTTVTRKEFNDNIEQIRNLGGFDFVKYSLSNQAPYDLVIGVDERQNASVHVGFRFDSHELASLLLGTEMTLANNYFKPRIALTTRLSESPYVQLKASSSRVFFGEFSFAYRYQYNNFAYYNGDKRSHTSTFDYHNLAIRFSDIYLRNFNISAGVEADFFNYSETFYQNGKIEVEPEAYINYNISGHYDNLNDIYVPTRGWSLDVDYTLHTNNGIEIHNHTPFASLQYEFTSALSLGSWATLVPSLYGRTLIGMKPTYPYYNCFGGILPARYMPQQMPFVGVQHIELFDNSVMVGAIEGRVMVAKNHYLSAIYNLLIQDNDFRRMFRFEDTLSGFGLKYTYHTSLGPLTILASGTNRNPLGGVYVSFGKNF
ncbi:MAG: patatin-like phospholipase family protein [Tidjanibacter sp.]|nr:patatin-like phospholipase family protein [Tidjanibacter sp.]